MKFLLVADTPSTLPFVVKIDEQTIEDAMSRTATMETEELFMSALFLVDLESGEAKRMVRDGDGWKVSDTAYEKNLGVETPDEYFAGTGTQEIAE